VSFDAELRTVSVACPWCGETIEVDVDPSAGSSQELVEDCSVCCRPNLVRVRLDAEGCPAVSCEREGG
jgi:hypothetical protein